MPRLIELMTDGDADIERSAEDAVERINAALRQEETKKKPPAKNGK